MAKVIAKTSKVLDIVKKIGRTVYWLSLPVLLLLLVGMLYVNETHHQASLGVVVGNQTILSAQITNTCTPRAF